MAGEQDLGCIGHDAHPGEQVYVGFSRSGHDVGPRQVGIDLQIEPWRPALDPAQRQMLHRIEADHATGARVFDAGQHVLGAEHLQEPQDLHELPLATLA